MFVFALLLCYRFIYRFLIKTIAMYNSFQATMPARQKCKTALICGLLILAGMWATSQSKTWVYDNGYPRSLSERWELDSANRKGTFLISPYKPVYIIPGRWSSSPNERPISENPYYSLPFKVNYNNYEAKFQFSFKSKVAQNILGLHGDLWIAYTQKSHWQIYNEKLSRPFRETNFEPELILNFRTNYKLFGFRGRMFGVSFVHQSNGRALPLSRSWNRVVFHAAFERKGIAVVFRPWFRLKDDVDENPAIADFTGRGETIVIYSRGKYQLSVLGRHSLKFSGNSHGNVEANFSFPVSGYLKAFTQLFYGYGETMIDYNHKQTTIGIGICLLDW